MIRIMKDVYGLHSTIPAVYEDRNFSKEEIESSLLCDYTQEDHVVLKLSDNTITVVYSIDLDWDKYDPDTDKVDN